MSQDTIGNPPIVSCSGSLLYHLKIWVDMHLQKISTTRKLYLKNSLELKVLLMNLGHLPRGAQLFTSDATLMYTNINKHMALVEISQYIHQREEQFSTIPTGALAEALAIIIQNNDFVFGDTFWHQKRDPSGTNLRQSILRHPRRPHTNKILRQPTPLQTLHRRYFRYSKSPLVSTYTSHRTPHIRPE